MQLRACCSATVFVVQLLEVEVPEMPPFTAAPIRSLSRWCASVFALVAIPISFAQTASCPFNVRAVDATSAASASVDGQLVVRVARGLRDAPLVNGLSSAVPAPSAANVIAHVDGNAGSLDLDGDGEVSAVDSMIVARYLAGFRGSALTSGLAIPSAAVRRTSAEIAKFIDDGCSANLPVLPIEVIGPAGYVEEAVVTLGDATNINRLWLQCHRCGWRDSSVQSGIDRGAKASVRLNGGAWIDISNATAAVEEPEKSSGGIGGGYHTTRFAIPITGAVKGRNTLEFRFNKHDGLTSGYRIVGMNFLRSDNRAALGKYATALDDPTQWTPQPSSTSAPNLNTDIAAGRALWTGSVPLKESPLSNTVLKASCASCHANDGRDLKYFNYSDWSIRMRSEFHGLTTTQGKQLAAYIRSLTVPAPKQARPWNPPYQPGPGMDSKPVQEWAAGAGLQAVLRTDAEMLPYLFPNGTTNLAVRNVINKTTTINIREMPIALQLPDWNDWLPHQHPLDALGETLFNNTASVSGKSLPVALSELDSYLGSAPFTQLNANGELNKRVLAFTRQAASFLNTTQVAAEASGLDPDIVRPSLATWAAVKQWDLMQRYGLEDKAPLVHGSHGESRSWLSWGRNVFEIAPHRSSITKENFVYQTLAVGKYFSTAWYQLQVTINAGNRQAINLWPVDWNYQPNHIAQLHLEGGGPTHPLRYLASHAKMYQQYSDGKPIGSTAMGFRQMHIARYVPGQAHGIILDSLPQPLRLRAYEALLTTTMDVLENYPPDQWERGFDLNGDVSQIKAEPIDYVLTRKTIALNNLYPVCNFGERANCWYIAIPYFKAIGVDPAIINRLIDWGKAMWPAPANNWDALR
jgi:hypothetical protein